MMKMTKNDWGFHLTAVVLAVVVIGAIGLVGYKVFSKNDKNDSTTNSNTQQAVSSGESSDVTWQFNGEKWEASATAPACKDPFKFESPTDLSKATQVLYPAQQRSTGYKTHGGFRFDNSNNEDITVKAPFDSHLIKASRYIEQGDVQYFMVFTIPCGMAYRLDHLLTLSPKFQAVIDKLPAAKVDDSRTTPIEPALAVKTGEVVATAVGFVTNKNVSFDFGVYDLRATNEISKDASWAAKHADDKEFAPYGVCWLDMFNATDSAKVKSLPAGDTAAGKTSDYCK